MIYGTIVPKVMALIQKGFEAQYGIKTEYWRGDATKVIDRVLTEWRAGKPNFDVVLGARGPLALASPKACLPNIHRRGQPIFRRSSKTGTVNLPRCGLPRLGFFTIPNW